MEKAGRKTSMNANQKNKNQTNMWQEILREVMTNKHLDDYTIFVFGDKMSGKKSLFRILNEELEQNNEELKKTLSIEEEATKYGIIDYTYLHIKNKTGENNNSEIIGKFNVWIFNDYIDKQKFLSLIKPEYIINSICLIMVDLSRPWSIKENLIKWTNFVKEVFENLIQKLPEEKQKQLKEKISNIVKTYEEPQFDEKGELIKEKKEEKERKESNVSSTSEKIIKEVKINLGIPLFFVVNKSDVTQDNDKKKIFDEKSEFILSHIRQIALDYGSAIIYTSAKTNCNLKILYQYLCHILFNYPLINKPNLIDKEAYFIPAGHDDSSILDDNELYLSKTYEKEFEDPNKKKSIVEENDVICEDTKVFLSELKKITNKSGSKIDKNDYASINKTRQSAANPFLHGSSNLDEIKNFYTNMDKKFIDKKLEIRSSLNTNSGFAKRESELKGKTAVDPNRKRNIKEEMMRKLNEKKMAKTLDKK